MKKSLILLMFFIGCTAVQKQKTTAPEDHGPVDSLKKFFERCERDLTAAKRVVLDNDLVKNLSHLQYMDHGGKKYYLLERETITKMIKSVTEGVYDDCILVNKHGVVIYSMYNDDIFGKNVLTGLKTTVLKECYDNRDIDPYIGRVSHIPPEHDAFYLTVSSKIKGGETLPGILILQFDTAKLKEFIGETTIAVDNSGICQIAADNSLINKPFGEFDGISLNAADGTDTVRYYTGAGGKKIAYRFFKYSNLTLVLVRAR